MSGSWRCCTWPHLCRDCARAALMDDPADPATVRADIASGRIRVGADFGPTREDDVEEADRG